MDQNAASAPGLISSLEAMIEASVASIFDRRLGLTADTLYSQVEAAVAAAVDKRLRLEAGSLYNRMTSLIDQRLGNAVGTLNYRVDKSVTAALEQRLGPAGSALDAQITFTAVPFSTLPSVPPPNAQALRGANGGKESNKICPTEEELATGKITSSGNPIEQEQPTEKQSVGESEASQMPLDPGHVISTSTATAGEGNERTSKETDVPKTGASEYAVYSIFAGNASNAKADTGITITAKPNEIVEEPSSTTDKAPTKRKANQRGEAKKANNLGNSETSSSEEEESDNEQAKPKRKRKRPKVKLDPPGFNKGPMIKFRRVSPKLTASTKCRGHPRVVDLKSFSEASNKQNFTMADVIATVLFNYDPMSLYAFMDTDMFPAFQFVRKEKSREAKNFVIEKSRTPYGVLVKASAIQLD